MQGVHFVCVSVCEFVCMGKRNNLFVCVFVFVCERDSVCVCVCVRECVFRPQNLGQFQSVSNFYFLTNKSEVQRN